MAKKKSTAGKIEAAISELETLEKKMQQRVKKLERKGCENLNLHIKAGTNKMFHRGGTPDPQTGKRDYRYIGTDPKKQQAALDAVKRYNERQALLHAMSRVNGQYTKLSLDLQEIEREAEWMLDEWRGSQLDLLG